MKYIKLFDNHSQYESYAGGGGMLKPNVSHCVEENEVHYNPRTWADEYFTTVALGSGTIDFTIFYHADTSFITSFAYSKNDGEWVETQNRDSRGEDENIVISVGVEEGDKVRWKGIANHIGLGSEGDNGGVFTSTCRFNAQGNIMSLLYGDDFKNKVTLENGNEFSFLFHDINTENDCLVVNASNLILPATTLAEYCYSSMFHNCTSLTTVPELPATTLADGCYEHMFEGCTSLTTAPQLHVTTLANYCYRSMFADCTSLTTAPVLPATTLANGCYSYMFYYCTSLTTAPTLPATTLAQSCYSNMFRGCTSLVTAPVLSATILANSCYLQMFMNCTSLTTAPELPATTLVTGCYQSMFYGCSSLTMAPELPATTLAYSCYHQMFQGCSKLNYIKAMFTTTPSTTYTTNWVSGVAASGTFVKNAAATWNVTGDHGIPTGWTVQTATA